MGKVSILISYLGCQLAYMFVICFKFGSSESSFLLINGSCIVILAVFFGLLLQKSPGQLKSQNSKFHVNLSTNSFQQLPNTSVSSQKQCTLEKNTIIEQSLQCQSSLSLSLRNHYCPKCQNTIPTYDHHCNIMNKCIGEKNRQYFYLFCLTQTLQGAYILFYLIKVLIETGNKDNFLIMAICFSLIVTFLAVTMLSFQTYFMIFNVTMEEFMNRQNIPYLKNQDKRFPFSKGIFGNLCDFWIWSFKDGLIKWELK